MGARPVPEARPVDGSVGREIERWRQNVRQVRKNHWTFSEKVGRELRLGTNRGGGNTQEAPSRTKRLGLGAIDLSTPVLVHAYVVRFE